MAVRRTVFILAAASLLLAACGTQRKIEHLRKDLVSASIALPSDNLSLMPELHQDAPDTISVQDNDGQEVLIMKAVRDEDGEMVATDVITAARVTARFRNVAERHGRVDLEFQVTVPESMQDSRWQLRLYPDMFIMSDSVRLDPVVITGKDYRKAQLRGYQQYERFVNSIITDTTLMINMSQLEIFLDRNLPDLYAFKNDTTEVSDEAFASVFGVTEQDAVKHYTNRFLVSINDYKKSHLRQRFNRYVKVPIVTEGLRLDTVLRAVNGDFIYNYVQTVNTRPQLRKVDINLSGEIYEQDKRLYDIPRSEPLTFYISSISTLAGTELRYLTKVIERRVEANTACYIEFEQGRAEVIDNLGNNAEEIGRIKDNLKSLLENESFDLDSIVVTASASPEGSFRMNAGLSEKRSAAVSKYFNLYMKHTGDSLLAASGMSLSIGDASPVTSFQPGKVEFISRSNPENWVMLDAIVRNDETLTPEQKDRYFSIIGEKDPDIREGRLAKESFYPYFRQTLYPRLRTVKFDFHLHRRGMVKDTVHTTVLDSTYLRGVQAIKDRDYQTAVTLLRPYHDYNTAVAYCAMDYNQSALEILQDLVPTPQINYMTAILYSRTGRERDAVEKYLQACRDEPSYVHRGNLDPEISALIRLYGLNRQEEDTF